MLGTDKKRLSKRNAATSLEDYREKGYLDSAILNTLARLGWSQGENEVFYLDDLIRDFNIKEVQKAGAIFDITKLDWLNSQHLSKLSLEEVKDLLKPFLDNIDIKINDHKNVNLLIESLRTSDNNLSNIANNLYPYYKDIKEYDDNAINKFVTGNNILLDLKEILLNIDDWDEETINNALTQYQEENNLKVPQVNQPVRIALTGKTKSPGLGLTLEIFGKELSLKRIDKLLSFL